MMFPFFDGKSDQRGFTLPEILTVITIIGTLSTIGAVSYESVRANSRDVKRVSDLKQVQSSVELYFETHSSYPGDGRPGDEGKILGLSDSRTFSDAGFTSNATTEGVVYMLTVPKNPEPHGSPYVYRAMYRDGTNCDTDACDSYALIFTLEKDQGSYLAGAHAVTPAGIVGAEGGSAGEGVTAAGGKIIGVDAIQATLARTAEDATAAVALFVQDERVQVATEVAVAPTVTVVAVANTALSTSSFAAYGVLFLTQPFLFFGRRKRKAWGTVYNSLSKLGEDLVIVRLRDAATGRILKSTVTDAEGRFSFLAQQGRYRVEAAKNGFVFPSVLTAGQREDGSFADLYHGQVIEVGAEGAIVTPNIPFDPTASVEADDVVRKKDVRRRFRRSFSEFTLLLGGLAFAIRPTLLTGLLFAAQFVAYLLFRRLVAVHEPKRWGIVYDQETRKPVPNAITRVFESRFNKLLESQVTDRHGRYHFRVGGNVYYLTVTKTGYRKTETTAVDLSGFTEPTVIASDIPLAPASASAGVSSSDAVRTTADTTQAPVSSTLASSDETPAAATPAASELPTLAPTVPEPVTPAPAEPPAPPVVIDVPIPSPEKPAEEPRPDQKGWLNSL